MKLIPQFLGLQATGNLSHLLAGDDGSGRDKRFCTQRGRTAAEIPMRVHNGYVTQRNTG